MTTNPNRIETLDVTNAKCVFVIDAELPLGLLANAAAVLAASLGKEVPDLIGPDIEDGSGSPHAGLTRYAMPILKSDGPGIRELRNRALETEGLYVVGFTDVAQRSRDYDDYGRTMAALPEDDLQYVGLALYGPQKLVRKLTSSLPLLR